MGRENSREMGRRNNRSLLREYEEEEEKKCTGLYNKISTFFIDI